MARLEACAAVLLVLFAGCVGGDGEKRAGSPTEADAEPSPLPPPTKSFANHSSLPPPVDVNATTFYPTMEDWFYLNVTGWPERPIAGFRWRVPERGVVPIPSGAIGVGTPAERTTVSLVLAPYMKIGTYPQLKSWLLAVFQVDEGKAALLAAVSAGDWTHSSTLGPLTNEQRDDAALAARPLYLNLGVNDLAVDDEVFFVLGAETETPVEFGLAFRALPKATSFGEDPPDDFESFLTNVSKPAPVVLPRTGSGLGFRQPAYWDGAALVVIGNGDWTSDVTVTDAFPVDPRPYASVRDLTLSFEHPSERGWAYGEVEQYGYFSVGTWSSKVDVHGGGGSAEGLITPHGGQWGPELSADYGIGYRVLAEGEGSSAVSFHVTLADAPSFIEYITFVHFDLGETLVNLIGIPAATSWTPKASPAPREPLAVGGNLVLSGGGPTIVLVGALGD